MLPPFIFVSSFVLALGWPTGSHDAKTSDKIHVEIELIRLENPYGLRLVCEFFFTGSKKKLKKIEKKLKIFL